MAEIGPEDECTYDTCIFVNVKRCFPTNADFRTTGFEVLGGAAGEVMGSAE